MLLLRHHSDDSDQLLPCDSCAGRDLHGPQFLAYGKLLRLRPQIVNHCLVFAVFPPGRLQWEHHWNNDGTDVELSLCCVAASATVLAGCAKAQGKQGGSAQQSDEVSLARGSTYVQAHVRIFLPNRFYRLKRWDS